LPSSDNFFLPNRGYGYMVLDEHEIDELESV
jgi:hypothetical protein